MFQNANEILSAFASYKLEAPQTGDKRKWVEGDERSAKRSHVQEEDEARAERILSNRRKRKSLSALASPATDEPADAASASDDRSYFAKYLTSQKVGTLLQRIVFDFHFVVCYKVAEMTSLLQGSENFAMLSFSAHQ